MRAKWESYLEYHDGGGLPCFFFDLSEVSSLFYNVSPVESTHGLVKSGLLFY